jgi:hypothetical protein
MQPAAVKPTSGVRNYPTFFPPDFTASARYSSSLISQTHWGPSGSFVVARHSIGSMNPASVLGKERSFASAVRFAGTVQGVYRPGRADRKYFDPLQFPLQCGNAERHTASKCLKTWWT